MALTLTALQDACEWTVTSSDPAPVTGREFRGQRSPHAERPIDRRRVRDVTGLSHRPLPPPLPRRAGRERWDGGRLGRSACELELTACAVGRPVEGVTDGQGSV